MGVNSEYGRLRKVLLCRPNYFRWLPINPVAKKALTGGQTFTIEDVKKQHQQLSDAFRAAGVEIFYIEQGKDLTYQVFTRDIGKNTKKGVLLGKFKLPERQGETRLYEEYFTSQGIPIFGRISKGAFEGGDAHYIDKETMALGIGPRSDTEGFEEAQQMLKEEQGINLIAVEIPNPFYHLDCVFVRVAERLCLAHTPALPDFFLRILKGKKVEIIEVSAEECLELKCNGVAIDEKTFLSFKENERVNRKLEALGFEVLKPDMSIFTRGGGGPRCSCFPLERDEV